MVILDYLHTLEYLIDMLKIRCAEQLKYLKVLCAICIYIFRYKHIISILCVINDSLSTNDLT